jgi:hypothetical protein
MYTHVLHVRKNKSGHSFASLIYTHTTAYEISINLLHYISLCFFCHSLPLKIIR